MPTSALVLFGKFPINLMGGETAGETGKIDFLSDTIKAALFTAAFTPDQDTQELYSALTNEVANGNGYTTGGATLAGLSIAYTGATNTSAFTTTTNPVWTGSGSGFAFRYVVFYDATTDLLIGYNDYGSTLTLQVTDTFTYIFDAVPIFTALVA